MSPSESDPLWAKSPRRCAFCGSDGPLTREHVFGDWLKRQGLDVGPAILRSGYLNRIGKTFGPTAMFTQTVRAVCGQCNSGWMSRLEALAQTELGPLISGDAGNVSQSERGGLALWALKTAHVAMLVSSESERSQGYGLPPSSYQDTYDLRDAGQPFPGSVFWLGRVKGAAREAGAWVVPVAIERDARDSFDQPDGYLITLLLGSLLVQGAWVVEGGSTVSFDNKLDIPRLWPGNDSLTSSTVELSEPEFLRLARAGSLAIAGSRIGVSPWRPATDLERSQLIGDVVLVPAPCGKHSIRYPAFLAAAAMAGEVIAFLAGCECEIGYVVQLGRESAKYTRGGDPEQVEAAYEELDGDEFLAQTDSGEFVFKRLA